MTSSKEALNRYLRVGNYILLSYIKYDQDLNNDIIVLVFFTINWARIFLLIPVVPLSCLKVDRNGRTNK